MALTADRNLTTTTTANMTSITPTTLLNNIHTPSAVDGVLESSHFGVYKQTAVGAGYVSIRTLIPAAISASSYRKALISKIFFRQILALTDNPSTSFNDLMTTVALYFPLNTGAAEREAESAVTFIRSNFLHVSNLQGVGFFDSSGQPITVPDPDNCPKDLTYFTFRSVVNTADIDNRAPDKSLSLEFSLHLPQTVHTLPPSSGFLTTQTVATPLALAITQSAVSTLPRLASQLSFELDSYTDDSLKNLDPAFMLELLSDARLAPTP